MPISLSLCSHISCFHAILPATTKKEYAEMPRVALWQMAFEENYLKNDKFLVSEREMKNIFLLLCRQHMKMLKYSCCACKIFHKLNEFILSALKSWNACRIKSLCFVATTMKQPSVHAIAKSLLNVSEEF